ncbi:ABC transporter substrate-binding protein [Microbacterium oleivorans]|uniref:Sugar ABC transporter substrate-binding protein n=1 Tax=Microbacterium oleivorans TaxID=273677 RepID=A0A7D5EX02_9MICO|nr:sugar ABC transporter substrate-binding protein [Microbacterium oleivorans]QLD11966.1 sugar ABC transporter substrate-binding protein [Microbacterium oleivorans]
MDRIIRTTGAAVLAAALLVPLASCAAETAPGSTTTESALPEGEITFWSALAGMDSVAEAFNDSQDRIHVTFESVSNGANGGYAKLAAAISAGQAPDVATIEYYALPQFASSGSLQSLTGIYSDDVLNSFSRVSRSLITLGGEVWALPYDAPPSIVWYRQDLLEAAGVEVPRTWEEFADAARAVHETTGGYLASFNANEPSWYAALAWQNGAQWFDTDSDSWVVDLDDAATTDVAQFWQGLIDDGAVKAVASYSDEWTNDIASGTAAGIVGASWSATGIIARAPGQEGAWVAAELPVWDGAEPVTPIYGGSTFAVPASSENGAAAAEFIEFLTTDPAAIEARGDTGSAYLANSDLTAVSQAAFDASFFANDIWAVFDKAASRDSGSWQWGPNFDLTATAMKETMGATAPGGRLAEAFASIQARTVDGLAGLGLSVGP